MLKPRPLLPEFAADVALQERLLREAESNMASRASAERPLASTPLGDGHTPDGGGPVGVRPEFLGEMREERGDPVRLYGRQRDAIHAGRAPLGAHQGPGVTQEVGPGDLVIEEVKPEGGLRLGLAVQLPLEVPHTSWRFEPHGNPPASSP